MGSAPAGDNRRRAHGRIWMWPAVAVARLEDGLHFPRPQLRAPLRRREQPQGVVVRRHAMLCAPGDDIHQQLLEAAHGRARRGARLRGGGHGARHRGPDAAHAVGNAVEEGLRWEYRLNL